MRSTNILILSAILGVAMGFPSSRPSYDNAEELADKFEGDMDLTPEQLASLASRNGLVKPSERWVNNTIDYVISGDFSKQHKDYIRKALDHLELVTCLKFVGHNTGNDLKDYVDVINSGSGCSSKVGRIGGRQTLNLAYNAIEVGCFRLATIMHEFIHALGFYHMQSTHDRDNYVEVKYENIEPGKEHNFKKYEVDTVTDFDVEYDYKSVMHYSSSGFSKNGLPTLVPRDPTAQIGQRLALSRRDIEKINRMYGCPL